MPGNEIPPHSRGGSAASNILQPPRPSSSGNGTRPPSYPSIYDTPQRPGSSASGTLQFFSASRKSRPTSSSSLQAAPSDPLAGSASLLSTPPSPARVRGQRASTSTPYARGPSPSGRKANRSREDKKRVREKEEKEREETLKLPGEEVDDFGLPIRQQPVRKYRSADDSESDSEPEQGEPKKGANAEEQEMPTEVDAQKAEEKLQEMKKQVVQQVEEANKSPSNLTRDESRDDVDSDAAFESAEESPEALERHRSEPVEVKVEDVDEKKVNNADEGDGKGESEENRPSTPDQPTNPEHQTPEQRKKAQAEHLERMFETSLQPDAIGGISAVSHQALAIKAQREKEAPLSPEADEWKDMRAYGKYDIYDEEGHVMAKGMDSEEEDDDVLSGGARKGYTKLTFDEDVQSQTSMDENTSYLFSERSKNLLEEDEETRNPLQQMQATKDLLTEGQRIAYVGLTRLSISKMVSDLECPDLSKKLKKDYTTAVDAMKMWGQKMMVRLYAHMEIESSEQIMIEQLTDHGVEPADLTPLLMQNARVKNPMADEKSADFKSEESESARPSLESRPSMTASRTSTEAPPDYDGPPAFEDHKGDELTVQSPTMLPGTKNLDIDLRWTVLCDLFLVLIADSIYDSRSRRLLEVVGDALKVSWMDICKFEKRVTDALEMEEASNRENWDEKENVETRRKLALKRRYVIMGLATVGGSIVIGLSAGVLAPVIGAGLGAGFTAIGVSGTGAFMAGAGGAAIITSASATAGGIIAVRASNRRTGAVKTFEYRPLHNNKRVNLIVTISGWMNSKVDDVRLPFSTVDPVMGDIYSLLWEPDVLCSIGDTIHILATEALTQGLQQVLAATFLTTLMAGLSLPIVLSKLSYLIDNPWSVSLDRADAAGLILADSLVDRNLGVRPITLVGFSLGARVIFSALKELANKGAYGLIQNVYLFGSPIVAKQEEYLRVRTVISGRFVNGYATNDWIIGYLFRATAGGLGRVAGLAAVENVRGLENLDVTSIVNGHMAYRAAMPKLLREVGWEVESDEFAEIEDPDPDNHEARQRELIREIDSARQDQEKQGTKGRWASFWSKKGEKKGWETYDVNSARNWDKEKDMKAKEGKEDPNANILFDIDAIRRELESEQLQVRQLESTLPPMRLDMNRSQTEPNGMGSTEKRTSSETPTNSSGPAKGAITSPTSPKTSHARSNSRKWLPFGKSESKPKPEPEQHRRTSSWEEYDETADGQPGEGMVMSFEPKSPSAVPERSSSLGNEAANGWGHDEKVWEPHGETAGNASGWGKEGHEETVQQSWTYDEPVEQKHEEHPPALDVDHNAWADDVPSPGTKEGDVKMTFE